MPHPDHVEECTKSGTREVGQMSRDNLDPYSHPCVFHLTYAGNGAFWTYKRKKNDSRGAGLLCDRSDLRRY